MKKIQIQTLTMLESALATAIHNPPPTPPPDFPTVLNALSDTITQIRAAAVSQAEDRGSSSLTLQNARAALLERHLILIRDIAVGRLTTVPNVQRLFRIPKRKVSLITFVKEATIVASNAAQYESVFIASGLPADFLARLNAAIAEVTQARESRVNQRGVQIKATQSLKDLLKQGTQLIRALNGMMQVAFLDDPAVLTAWNSARRPRSSSSSESAASPTAPNVSGAVESSTSPLPTAQPAAATVSSLQTVSPPHLHAA